MKSPIHNRPPSSPTESAASGYRNRRVLVTGGLGFIGRNLAARLVKAGANVTVVDSMVRDCGAKLFNLAPVESEIRGIGADVGGPEEFELSWTRRVWFHDGVASRLRCYRQYREHYIDLHEAVSSYSCGVSTA